MKDFGRWFNDFRAPEPVPEVRMLPEGVHEVHDGEFETRCCRCGQWKPIMCDIEDIPMEGYEHYCGGSPHCCP